MSKRNGPRYALLGLFLIALPALVAGLWTARELFMGSCPDPPPDTNATLPWRVGSARRMTRFSASTRTSG